MMRYFFITLAFFMLVTGAIAQSTDSTQEPAPKPGPSRTRSSNHDLDRNQGRARARSLLLSLSTDARDFHERSGRHLHCHSSFGSSNHRVTKSSKSSRAVFWFTSRCLSQSSFCGDRCTGKTYASVLKPCARFLSTITKN